MDFSAIESERLGGWLSAMISGPERLLDAFLLAAGLRSSMSTGAALFFGDGGGLLVSGMISGPETLLEDEGDPGVLLSVITSGPELRLETLAEVEAPLPATLLSIMISGPEARLEANVADDAVAGVTTSVGSGLEVAFSTLVARTMLLPAGMAAAFAFAERSSLLRWLLGFRLLLVVVPDVPVVAVVPPDV